jgi:hypothetical protein
MLAGDLGPCNPETSKRRNVETLKPGTFLSSMRRTVVDDVQCSCYYQTVPRVKSGLPVHGSPVGCATWVARQAPGKSRLSFEEIRIRLKVGLETPSLKRPAKTFAPGV